MTYYNDPGNPLTLGATGYENGVGWNFIPNRYPSLLEVEAMVNDNPLTYPNIHVWDANTQQYISFLAGNSATVIPYNNDPAVATLNATFDGIEPFQGFWVKTTALTEADTVPFVLKDSYRSVSFSALNVAPTLKTTNHVQLNVFAASDSTWDGVSIAFNEQATGAFNPEKEAYKFVSQGNVPSLFAEKDKRWLNVTELHPTVQTVPVWFKPKRQDEAQDYFLHADRSTLTTDVRLILEDMHTGKWHDLDGGNYFFHAGRFEDPDRFILHFIDPDAPFYGLNDLENIGVYATAESIYIQSAGFEGFSEVAVYDITGRLLTETRVVLGHTSMIDIPPVAGIVLVQVNTPSGVVTRRLSLTQ